MKVGEIGKTYQHPYIILWVPSHACMHPHTHNKIGSCAYEKAHTEMEYSHSLTYSFLICDFRIYSPIKL
jgi:hypothetical protein